jgi:hypothetical protein
MEQFPIRFKGPLHLVTPYQGWDGFQSSIADTIYCSALKTGAFERMPEGLCSRCSGAGCSP